MYEILLPEDFRNAKTDKDPYKTFSIIVICAENLTKTAGKLEFH